MISHLDVTAHIKFPQDRDILTRMLFDVNMRLFHSSPRYKQIVLTCCDYIAWCSNTEKEGYKKPHGFSGANAAIPFNIIAVQRNSKPFIMINPVIIKGYGSLISESNCGSLTLEKPIKVKRFASIDIKYFNTDGIEQVETNVDRQQGGLTIQHEIEHNLGILITDKSI